MQDKILKNITEDVSLDRQADENVTLFHGTSSDSNLINIIKSGAITSSFRNGSTDMSEDWMSVIKEDILRIESCKYPDMIQASEYIDKNEEVLVQEGSELTKGLIESDNIDLFADLIGELEMSMGTIGWPRANAISVSSDEGFVLDNYAGRNGGGYFEFKLPYEAVATLDGVMGDPMADARVPGYISMAFTDAIYLEDGSDYTVSEIETELEKNGYRHIDVLEYEW